jgi:hypothetical protein
MSVGGREDGKMALLIENSVRVEESQFRVADFSCSQVMFVCQSLLCVGCTIIIPYSGAQHHEIVL